MLALNSQRIHLFLPTMFSPSHLIFIYSLRPLLLFLGVIIPLPKSIFRQYIYLCSLVSLYFWNDRICSITHFMYFLKNIKLCVCFLWYGGEGAHVDVGMPLWSWEVGRAHGRRDAFVGLAVCFIGSACQACQAVLLCTENPVCSCRKAPGPVRARSAALRGSACWSFR